MTLVSEFKGKYVITGIIHCETGLHVGAGSEGIQIGGMENPVIRDPLSDQPYIPGSSLKGKLRHWTEWRLGLIAPKYDKDDKFESCPPYSCDELKNEARDKERWQRVYDLARLFGPHSNDSQVRAQAGPSRLIVRDAFLTCTSVAQLNQNLPDQNFTEEKWENTIDRITSVANPRSIERVPRGAEFCFTLFLDTYDNEEYKLLKVLFAAMALVEDNFIGGGGTRGHGHISFKKMKVEWRPKSYYVTGSGAKEIDIKGSETVQQLISRFEEIQWRQDGVEKGDHPFGPAGAV